MMKKIILAALSIFTVMVFNGCSNIEELSSVLNSIKDNATNSNNGSSLTQSKITVWFDTQQSTITNWSMSIDNGSVIPKPVDPVLENYTFLGWYDNNVNGNLWDFNTPCTKDITLYALWEKVNTDNGNAGTDNGNTDDSDSSSGNNSEENTGNGNSDNSDTVTQPQVYTINYNNNNLGESIEPVSLMSNTTLYESHLPTLYAAGYIFQGWYYNDKKIIAGQFKLTENITLNAKWLKIDSEDKTAPAEVSDLSISLDNHRPVLKWINPTDNDFNTVIITYSKKNDTTTYGGHISSGAGNTDTYTVPKVMYNADEYTFTVQTVDYNNNKSDGISVKLNSSVTEPDPEPDQPSTTPVPEPDFSKYKNQTHWFYGIKGPLPSSSEWSRPEDKDWVWTLYWKEDYGWYDVNKTSSIDKELNLPVAADVNLCWAATSANILHWWFTLNAENIKKYDELNPDKAKNRPSSLYPQQGTKKLGGSIYQESEIFQYYIDHFEDDAGRGDDGVNWFISGSIPTAPAMTKYSGGGFFADVFPKGKYVATYKQGLSKRIFTEIFIDAIENHKAIGLSAKTGMNHLMTVWGAEFDENGYVSAIYLADNNVPQTSKPYDKQLTRRLIRYNSYEEYTGTYTEMSAFGTTSYSAVVSIVIVDLGTKQWEEYFKSKETGK